MITVKNRSTCWPVSTWVSEVKSFLTCNLLGQKNAILFTTVPIHVTVTEGNGRKMMKLLTH